MEIKCGSCGAVYSTLEPDGSQYFHSCPWVLDKKTGRYSFPDSGRDERVVYGEDRSKLGIRSEGKGVEPA